MEAISTTFKSFESEFIIAETWKTNWKSKQLQSEDRAIPVLNRPRQMITHRRTRKRTLTSLINCDSSRLPYIFSLETYYN